MMTRGRRFEFVREEQAADARTRETVLRQRLQRFIGREEYKAGTAAVGTTEKNI